MTTLYPAAALGVALGFALGIPLHHVAHARAAILMGDRKPRLMGRTSLSLKRHSDPLGTIVMPAVWVVATLFSGPFLPMFGWGKPQELDPRATRSPKAAAVVEYLAGPAATLLMAIVAAMVSRTIDVPSARAATGAIAVVGVYMTVFELLPIPGRDGGRLLATYLKPNAQLKMYEFAQYEVLFLLVIFLFLGRVINGMANPVCSALTGAPCSFALLGFTG